MKTTDGKTRMNIEELRSIYDHDCRTHVTFPNARREESPHVIRSILESGRRLGWIMWSDTNETSLEDIIRSEISYFEELGHDFEWKVYDYDKPHDLKDILLKYGFEAREPADAIMVLDLESAPDIMQQHIPDAITRIESVADIDGIVSLLESVWGGNFSSLGSELADQMQNTPDVISLCAACIDGQIVSAAWIQYFRSTTRFASLWGGTTLPAYRQQGLYTGLLSARAQEAYERGVRFLTVDASPMSRPILEKYGFVCIGIATACVWHVTAENETSR